MRPIVMGFDAAAIAAGIKKSGAPDLALVTSHVPCRAAAVFTRNLFPAAPVIFDRQLLALNAESIYGVLINAGCANACTGPEGTANARIASEQVALHLGAHEHSVLVMSTGVIGVQLPMEKLLAGIPQAVQKLAPDGWAAAAAAIMTTDTRPKLATRTATLGDATVTLTGMAKGAGMIHPNMATMLSVIATDTAIAQPVLQQALTEANAVSFNCISIDGDTSTNDTVIVLANGLAGNDEIAAPDGDAYAAFVAALTDLCTELAQAVVRDGEGVTCRVQPATPRRTRSPTLSPLARWSKPPFSAAMPTGGASWPQWGAPASPCSQSSARSSSTADPMALAAAANCSWWPAAYRWPIARRRPAPSLLNPKSTCGSPWGLATALPPCGRLT